MTPKDERTKERIGFLSRLLLAHVAGVYLLAGALGKFVMEWLAHDEFAWSNFGVVPAITAVAFVVMTFEVFRLRWTINRHIDQIGVPS